MIVPIQFTPLAFILPFWGQGSCDAYDGRDGRIKPQPLAE